MEGESVPILVITIDCECDKSADWTSSSPLSFRSMTKAIPQLLQPLCRRWGAVPTYLLSAEVLEDDASVEALQGLEGRHELGTHLHGDYVSPLKRYADYAGTLTSDFQCDYADKVQEKKLANLTGMFRARLGCSPTSFRAGRFGANGHTIRVLERLGYKVDSSVLPGLRESTLNGEIDFLRAPAMPYFPSFEDIGVPGEARVLEVPVSVWHHPLMRRLWGGRTIHGPRSVSDRALNRLLPSPVVRPTYYSAQSMIGTARRLLRSWPGGRPGLGVINMMFHSMEMVPGASPYVSDAVEAERFVSRIEAFLAWWSEAGYRFSGLSALADLAVSVS